MRLVAYGNEDNDGGDRQLAIGNVDNNRRQQRQALEGEDDGGGLGRRFGRGGGEWHKQRWRTRAVEDSGGGGGLWEVTRAYHNIALSVK